jgi:hypothetical protein
LRHGKSCTWLRECGLTTRYYHWDFPLGEISFNISNENKIKQMGVNKVISVASTAHHIDNRENAPFANLNVSFSVLNNSNEEVLFHENVFTDEAGLATWSFIPTKPGVYDVFAAPQNTPEYETMSAKFFQVIVK